MIQNKSNLRIATLLLNRKTGAFINADQCIISTDPAPDIDGVIDINPDEKNSIEYYSLDGRMIATPQKGLNLVKTADGKVIKVFVK